MSESEVDIEEPWYSSIVMSPLLAAARNTYIRAVREGLADAGLDDLPKRGPFVLGAIANHGSTLSDAVAGLPITKQAASQLVDALVLRGYLERAPDPSDRRRITVTLTERGMAAAEATRHAIASVDAALVERVGGEAVATARAVLGALVELGPHERDEDD